MVFLLSSNALATPAIDEPPVPVQAESASGRPLHKIEQISRSGNRLLIMGADGDPLTIKSRLLLSNPSRLVVDIADAKLGGAALPFTSGELGDVPINAIRLGQFTGDTVRIVVETPEPERLQVSAEGEVLAVTAIRSRNRIGNLLNQVFGRQEERTPPAKPFPSQPVTPVPSRPAVATATGLENLRRLRLEQMASMPNFAQRNRILDAARSQLGLSKDLQRDYVNQTFSQGRDNAWCADFVSTIMDWNGGSPWGHKSRVQDIYDWGMEHNRLTDRPEPGNLVILTYGNGSFDHIAFVETFNPDNSITTIGGNEGYAAAAAAATTTSGSVSRSVYKMDDRRILGFLDPFRPAAEITRRGN